MKIEEERKAFEAWAEKETNWDLYWSKNISQYMDHQTNGAWLSWLSSANRQGYKLVPEKPNSKQVEKAVYDLNLSGNTDILVDIYMAMIGGCDD